MYEKEEDGSVNSASVLSPDLVVDLDRVSRDSVREIVSLLSPVPEDNEDDSAAVANSSSPVAGPGARSAAKRSSWRIVVAGIGFVIVSIAALSAFKTKK